MKRKSIVITFSVAGILSLSMGFTNVFAKGQTDVSVGDKYKVVTVEEQNMREKKTIEGKNVKTVITVEEQNMVENSSALSGIVPQENGTGFYFVKIK